MQAPSGFIAHSSRRGSTKRSKRHSPRAQLTPTAQRPTAGSPAPRVTPDKTDARRERPFLATAADDAPLGRGMRQALSVDVSKLPPECLNDVVKIVLNGSRERAEVTHRLQHDPGAGLRRAAGLRREVAPRAPRRRRSRAARTAGPAPGSRRTPPPPRRLSDRPRLSYAAVAVAAVAAVVMRRRRTCTRRAAPAEEVVAGTLATTAAATPPSARAGSGPRRSRVARAAPGAASRRGARVLLPRSQLFQLRSTWATGVAPLLNPPSGPLPTGHLLLDSS